MVNERFGDFERADAIFSRALERPPEEREAFINDECGTDRALLERVRDLLQAAEETGALSPGGGLSARFWPDAGAREEAPYSGGERIGPWRIIKKLGHGGMGVVYLAEREGDFEQRVALKLVKRGMDTEAILRRFHRERQVLAGLEHQNIARLIDGGATEQGQPWFAMEYIEFGLPITEYCDQNRLSIGQRIALMIKVCEAVQFPHSRLTIHRDLKPSNILVTTDGEPKLLDFGLAKVLHDSEGDATVTVRDQRWMTLDYASPGQIRGDPVGMSSDTYQLGLILYELLTGKRAYSVKGLSPTEAERVICEQVPTRPSTAVQTSDAAGLRIAQLPPGKLSKLLKGDLDTILLKALHKDPTRGYTSAEHLADDLRAYLSGRPVKARPDNMVYRMRKFVTRHAAGVATTIGVIALTVALVAFYTNRLQDERDRARAEADKAEQVVEFLAALLEEADPDRAQGSDVTVRQVLDQAARNIDHELAFQPELRATMQALIGRIYGQLQLYDDAETQLAAALENQTQILGASDAEVAATAERLVPVYLGLGRWDKAESLARDNLEMRQRTLGGEHPDLAASLITMARVHFALGQAEEGRALVERALALVENVELEKLADTLAVAARIELEAGELAAAEQLVRREVDLRRGFDPPRTRALAQALDVLAQLMMLRGQPEHLAESEAMMLEAIDIERDMLGDKHHWPAFLLAQLATIRARSGDFDGGERAHLEALDAVTAALGPDNPEVGTVLNNIAVFYHRQGKWPEAIDYYSRALDLRIPALEDNHPLVGTTRAYLGLALHMAGDERAESTYRAALAELIESRGADHEKVGNLRTDLGLLLAEAGRYEEAEPELRTGLAIAQPIFGDADQRTDSARAGLGFALCGLGRADDGESFLNASRKWREFRYSEDHWRRFELDLYDVECRIQRGRLDSARQLLGAALDGLARNQPEDHILFSLGRRLHDRIQSSAR